MDGERIPASFFIRDVLDIAPDLIGKYLVRKFKNGQMKRYLITETEAYRGVEDLACHASKGRTRRSEIMFGEGGKVYVYLIYGMYWMLNFVAGAEDDASAVLIRAVDNISGPGRVGRELQIDKSFYGENLVDSERIWLEKPGMVLNIKTSPRIGIQYAGEPWISKPWRFEAILKTF